METWVQVIDFPEYEVSDLGRVRRAAPARGAIVGGVLRPYGSNGYLKVTLTANGKRRRVSVHRLVLESFSGKPSSGLECCHNNGVRSDNRLENLRWASRSENMQDAKKHGTAAIGERNGHAVLRTEDVLEIRELRRCGEKVKVLSKKFNVCHQAISDICTRRNWKHI